MIPSEHDPVDPFYQKRQHMVEVQLRRRGVGDQRVLAAMEKIPRHLFVEPYLRDQAYDDNPLPIGLGQTISQPYMVARMVELCDLKKTDRILEVGAGSGYQTAVLASLCEHVFATEILDDLVQTAKRNLVEIQISNVTLEQRDGSAGWVEHSPFNVIIVAAGAPVIPPVYKEQLAEGGRVIIPVGNRGLQVLHRLIRQGNEWIEKVDTPCRFVSLRGKYGWQKE